MAKKRRSPWVFGCVSATKRWIDRKWVAELRCYGILLNVGLGALFLDGTSERCGATTRQSRTFTEKLSGSSEDSGRFVGVLGTVSELRRRYG